LPTSYAALGWKPIGELEYLGKMRTMMAFDLPGSGLDVTRSNRIAHGARGLSPNADFAAVGRVVAERPHRQLVLRTGCTP
jgi:hypothetical protein